MVKKGICVLMLVLLPFVLFAGNTGKIKGTVLDKETGEALPGANVLVVGTQMGATSDVNGNYMILNVPPGTYVLKATFVGYTQVSMSNVKVVPDVTTESNFKLPQVALGGETITIVAEKPLVDKNVTNYTKTVWAEDLANLPVRTVQNVVATLAGAVQQGGNLYVRGGRSHETARYVEGMMTSSIVDGGENISIVDRSIELIDFQAGGFTAEYGFANSGVVHTTIKTGGPSYKVSLEAVSDDFWALNDEEEGYRILGINKLYSYGYDDYFATLSGPLIPGQKNLRFFVAGQHSYRLSNATRFSGWESPEYLVPGSWRTTEGTTVYDTLNLAANIAPGRIPGGGNQFDVANGNVVWDLGAFRFKVGGSYTWQRSQDRPAAVPLNAINTIYNTEVAKRWRQTNYSTYFQMTHNVNPTMFYTWNVNYFGDNQQSGHPVYWQDITKWGDPVYNKCYSDTGSAKTYSFMALTAYDPAIGTSNTITKASESFIGTKLDLTKQFGRQHEVKVGGEFNYYTIRRYQLSARSMLTSLTRQARSVGTINEITDYYAYRSFLTNYGYDIYGNEVNEDQTYFANVAGEMVPFSGHDAPPHPILAGAYIQDKIELKDMVLNLGVRMDYFDRGIDKLRNWETLTQASSGFFDEEVFVKSDPDIYISPRIGFSFPVTDMTVFHAQYGKFVQMNRFDQLFGSWGTTAFNLFASGYARTMPNPNLKPERTTSYEFGFRQQLGQSAAFDATLFYKNTDDLIAIRKIVPAAGSVYASPYLFSNADFGTIKGVSFDFQLRRWKRIAANANYTYSFSEGTGSAADSHFDIAWAEGSPVFPVTIAPLDFDVRHKGTISADVRLGAEDGPTLFGLKPLANVGLNMLFTFNSGAPYTRIESGGGYSEVFGYTQGLPIEALNQSRMPWVYNIDAKLDKTIKVAGIDLNVYLWALNLLDTKSVTAVFLQTGTNQSDGWLDSATGRQAQANSTLGAEEYARWYNAQLTSLGTFGWQAPRQLRAGIKIDL